MKNFLHFKKELLLSVVVIFLITVLSSTLFAYPTGITGRTLKSITTGCSSCHTQGAQVTGTLTGPDTVLAGSTVAYTINISHTNGGLMGCDIAVQRGTLAVGSGGTYLRSASGELTHIAGISGSSIQISFNYTAPTSIGWDTLYATVDAAHSGNWAFAPNMHIYVKNVSGIINQNLPLYFRLNQNYPNPFNPTTQISFTTGSACNVKLIVYDILGNEVATLLNEKKDAGYYEIEFNANYLSSGVYFYKLETNQMTDIKRMTLLK
jgi:hypothetical protein